ncbi:MAG: DNA-processing protein DprA [Campylobacterota bacterium]
MIKKIDFKINELSSMKKPVDDIYFLGDKNLLKSRKISIVGTRRPSSYTKQITHKLSSELSNSGFTIVSGGAMGVDAIAHKAANNNTIAVMANGLDIRYPSVNKNLIEQMETNSLVLSSYKPGSKARNYTFVLRNEIVVALGEILIITQADIKSGSLTSAKYAKQMGKKIYTIPHRMNESLGTQELIEQGICEPIYNIEKFIDSLGGITTLKSEVKDEFLEFCKTNPTLEEASLKYQEKIFEYELLGKIFIKDGRVYPN